MIYDIPQGGNVTGTGMIQIGMHPALSWETVEKPLVRSALGKLLRERNSRIRPLSMRTAEWR